MQSAQQLPVLLRRIALSIRGQAGFVFALIKCARCYRFSAPCPRLAAQDGRLIALFDYSSALSGQVVFAFGVLNGSAALPSGRWRRS